MRWTDFIRRARQPRPSASSDIGQWIEAALLVILLIQVARLLWALVTPVGLFGEWRAREPVVVGADARRALFAGFDPFFRAGVAAVPGQPAVQQVTSLPLRLYGIRLNEASGQGSAIIAGEDGAQASYAVGEEIVPGVTLRAVRFDHVVIERGGASEQLYIDQSGDAATADAPPEAAPSPPAAGQLAAQMTPQGVLEAVSFVPRTENGGVTGVVVNARGSGELFARAGFRPGDIIVQMNGAPIRSMGDIQALQSAITPGARISLMVERGSATVPISLILPENR